MPPGTLCLWIFWPSFNSVLLSTQEEKRNAVMNTYYALAVSTVTAISMSALAHPHGKINMVRSGAAPWAARGFSGPGTHTHACSPQHQPHGLGKCMLGDGALSPVPWSTRKSTRLSSGHWTLGDCNDQRLTGGGGGWGADLVISIDI